MTLLSILVFIAVLLTCTMFLSRQAMLGFPCVIFWALVGGQAYTLSVIPWGDIYYFIFFGSLFGMTIFTALAAYGLREKPDTLADEEMEKGESDFLDDGGGEGEDIEGEEPPKVSERTKRIRDRAKQRRTEVK